MDNTNKTAALIEAMSYSNLDAAARAAAERIAAREGTTPEDVALRSARGLVAAGCFTTHKAEGFAVNY